MKLPSLQFAVAGAILAGLLSAAFAAHASIVQALVLDELVMHSDRIVVGRVLLSESFQRSSGHIATWHRIEVERTLRGAAAAEAELIVETLGGRIGDLVMQVEGEPTFSVGERVVLFLRGEEVYGPFQSIGMGQGVMRIRVVGDVETVTQSREGMMLMRRSPGEHWQKSQGALSGTERLDLFLAKVKAILERQEIGDE